MNYRLNSFSEFDIMSDIDSEDRRGRYGNQEGKVVKYFCMGMFIVYYLDSWADLLFS